MAQSEWQGWGALSSPHRGSGLFLCFPKHRREVILLQECLPLPLKCSRLGRGGTHTKLHMSPRGEQAKGISAPISLGVTDGASCSPARGGR